VNTVFYDFLYRHQVTSFYTGIPIQITMQHLFRLTTLFYDFLDRHRVSSFYTVMVNISASLRT
ncbi:hypothetical protein PT064_08745, partial [Erysipelothrix rhusiopathiae]|nr:hypothetical protein [Erysipelothrix rhusiopathiae]